MTEDGINDNRNPWLYVPASDYEGHMNSETVGQLSVLNEIFQGVLKEIPSRNLAVLGCGTGNGFEHIDPRITERVLGIDINPEYLSILEKRYGSRLQMLELVCSDLNDYSCPDNSFDLIFAALVFEYIDYEKILERIYGWLTLQGSLVVILQLTSPESGMISETPYSSIKSLDSIMRLVNPAVFDRTAEKCGLIKTKEDEITLKLGKRFLVSYFKKAH